MRWILIEFFFIFLFYFSHLSFTYRFENFIISFAASFRESHHKMATYLLQLILINNLWVINGVSGFNFIRTNTNRTIIVVSNVVYIFWLLNSLLVSFYLIIWCIIFNAWKNMMNRHDTLESWNWGTCFGLTSIYAANEKEISYQMCW